MLFLKINFLLDGFFYLIMIKHGILNIVRIVGKNSGSYKINSNLINACLIGILLLG